MCFQAVLGACNPMLYPIGYPWLRFLTVSSIGLGVFLIWEMGYFDTRTVCFCRKNLVCGRVDGVYTYLAGG